MNKLIEILQRLGILRMKGYKYKGDASELSKLEVENEGLYTSQNDITKKVKEDNAKKNETVINKDKDK